MSIRRATTYCWLFDRFTNAAEEGLLALQTTQTLASSCGDSELQDSDLKHKERCTFWISGTMPSIQKRLIFHYQMRR